MTTLDELQPYITRGWWLFPIFGVKDGKCVCDSIDCDAPGKHPRIGGGVNSASNVPWTIRAWAEQFPDDNWALATGTASGVVAVDVDPRKGGADALREWEAINGALPATLTVDTGGGGTHLLFSPTSVEVIGNRVNMLPGVDFRAQGGYIVIDPSMHISGKRYKFRDFNAEIAPVPPSLLALVRSRPSDEATVQGMSLGELLKGVPEGSRDHTLFRAASRFRRIAQNANGGADDPIARGFIEGVVVEAAAQCDPPFPKSVALKKVDQAYLQDHLDGGADPYAIPEGEFWESRESLRMIYRNARARLVPPWAMLMMALQRALHVVPWSVQYQSSLGHTSLNSAVILSGPTGFGKGRTRRALDDSLRFTLSYAQADLDWVLKSPGSGEGLVDAYGYKATARGDKPLGVKAGEFVWTPTSRAHLFYVDEVQRMLAVTDRKGSTLLEDVKTGISGEPLGRTLARGSGVMLDPDSYRLGIAINVQPKRAGGLLTDDQIAGGLPSRFLWASVNDPTLATAETSDVQLYTVPEITWPVGHTFEALTVMNQAHDADIRQSMLGLREDIDSHAVLTRAKTACALAVLEGRNHLTPEDWELSASVMEHSRITRSLAIDAVRRVGVEERERRASARAHEELKKDEIREDQENELLERCLDKIRDLEQKGVPRSKWPSSVTRYQRKHLKEAIEKLDAEKAEREKGTNNV